MSETYITLVDPQAPDGRQEVPYIRADIAAKNTRHVALDAYRAGAAAAHHDTVEGVYNMAEAADSPEAEEWYAEYLHVEGESDE